MPFFIKRFLKWGISDLRSLARIPVGYPRGNRVTVTTCYASSKRVSPSYPPIYRDQFERIKKAA